MTARVLVTGSRKWRDAGLVEQGLLLAEETLNTDDIVLVHGDCPTGADAMADKAARALGWQVETHPADWKTHGKAAGPKRNQEMVDLGADLVLAFPHRDSRGTAHCMGAASLAGLPVWVFAEDETEE